jgi:hypothetical protein
MWPETRDGARPSTDRGSIGRRPSELREPLLDLGVRPGDTLMTHASLRRLGPVDGGAAGVIAARRDAVDTDDMGWLAEVFRTTPGVQVNDHPADRFAALGPAADAPLHPMPPHDYHGPGSVLERLCARGGKVLRLGANPDTVTLTHHAEHLARVPAKVRVRRRHVRADRGEPWIESLDDCHGIAQWAQGDYFPQVFLDFKASGGGAVRASGPLRGGAVRGAGVPELRRRMDGARARRRSRRGGATRKRPMYGIRPPPVAIGNGDVTARRAPR